MKYLNAAILNARTGQILFSLPFFLFGVKHLLAAPQIGGIMPEWVPFDLAFVYLAGVSQIAAAISIYIQKYTRPAMTMLVILLSLYILIIHLPGVWAGGEEAFGYLTALLKDLGLVGGAMLLGAGIKEPETDSLEESIR
ncbi:MAG TPA: DoxX family protein [Rhodothermales bacterium]|nr:DoxX family protein [Rhodothermales bacterium]HRR08212.1 DoxX family protein [Rhodothermales bacterium]